jgi:hypothetical protein
MAVKPPDYDVGFKRPPVHSRFQKGRSGNPKGRPRGKRNAFLGVADVLTRKVTLRDKGREREVTAIEAIVLVQIKKALDGDTRAALFVDRLAERLRADPNFKEVLDPPADPIDVRERLETMLKAIADRRKAAGVVPSQASPEDNSMIEGGPKKPKDCSE